VDNYNNLDNNKELGQRLRAGFFGRGGDVTVLGQRYLPYSVDPNSCQPIRIFHPRDRKSPLARLLLAPWRPLCILPVSDRLLLLLSLVFLYGSNLQASVQKHLYEPVTAYPLVNFFFALLPYCYVGAI